MAMAPLNLALGQPKSSGTSKWARILGGGLAGASFLPQLSGNKTVKDAMLSGGLGMLASGSPWGATAAIPSLVMGKWGQKQAPGAPGMYGPGINEPLIPDELGPESTAPGLPAGIPLGGRDVGSGWGSTPVTPLGGKRARTPRTPYAPAAVPKTQESPYVPFGSTSPADEVPVTPSAVSPFQQQLQSAARKKTEADQFKQGLWSSLPSILATMGRVR